MWCWKNIGWHHCGLYNQEILSSFVYFLVSGIMDTFYDAKFSQRVSNAMETTVYAVVQYH
jgi:hypothetical protein